MNRKKLSIIIPVYNEEKTIEQVLERLASLKFSKKIDIEIIVVDDGSTDNSKVKIQKAKIQLKIKNFKFVIHKSNLGKGVAVRSGLKKATGNIITIQDADLEYNPQDLVRMVGVMTNKNANVIYGSRLQNYPLRILGKKHTPLITHFIGNKLLSMMTNILYGSQVSDMETCYKMFKKEVLGGITLRSKRFEIEPEITAKVLKKGYKICEIPIKVKPRGYHEGKKISWRDGFIALWTLIKYRFID